MKAIRNNGEFRNIVTFTRKSSDWDRIEQLHRDEISEKLAEDITNLTIVNDAQYPASVDGPLFTDFDENFLIDNDYIFIYEKGDQLYLIDTQGYGYGRYIVELIEFTELG